MSGTFQDEPQPWKVEVSTIDQLRARCMDAEAERDALRAKLAAAEAVVDSARQMRKTLMQQYARPISPYADFAAGQQEGARELARRLLPGLVAVLAAYDALAPTETPP